MDEENEVQETKDKIIKEIKEIEARLAEAQDSLEYESDFFSGDAGLEEAKKKVEFEKKDLEHWRDLEKIAEARLVEIRKSKNIQATKEDEEDTSFTIAIIDLIDAYHYADIVDEERYAWVGWRGAVVYPDYGKIVELADRLFWALNPDKKTQEEWCELDDGYDVRVYDKNMSCVYKAHEKLPVKEEFYINGETEGVYKETYYTDGSMRPFVFNGSIWVNVTVGMITQAQWQGWKISKEEAEKAINKK